MSLFELFITVSEKNYIKLIYLIYFPTYYPILVIICKQTQKHHRRGHKKDSMKAVTHLVWFVVATVKHLTALDARGDTRYTCKL